MQSYLRTTTQTKGGGSSSSRDNTTTATTITIVWLCASCVAAEATAFVANSLNSCWQQADGEGRGGKQNP